MRIAVQSKYLTAGQEEALSSLRELSARVGSDPLLVQANNGNTSIKLDGVLWIKASGKLLAQAMQEDVLVPVDLGEVSKSIQNGTEVIPRHGVKNELRPSIETAMHAILRHRVVIHVHSINAIAWAIRQDGPKQLKVRLEGLRWRWIPYAASGISLAREIEKALESAQDTDVLILGNHGLVVCGRDCHMAENLLREVERRLAIAPRKFPGPDTMVLEMIARISRWQFPDVDTLHALGTDAVSQKILKGGVLYPCQAIFLGRTMPLFRPAVVVSKLTRSSKDKVRIPPFVAVERSGVMLNDKMTSAERATLVGLAQVVQRTEGSAQLRYLKGTEVAHVLSNGAHSYKGIVGTEGKANSPAEIDTSDEERRSAYE